MLSVLLHFISTMSMKFHYEAMKKVADQDDVDTGFHLANRHYDYLSNLNRGSRGFADNVSRNKSTPSRGA